MRMKMGVFGGVFAIGFALKSAFYGVLSDCLKVDNRVEWCVLRFFVKNVRSSAFCSIVDFG